MGSGGFNFIDISSGVTNSNNILMTIQGYNQTGIVGINTTRPQYSLDVNGSGKFSGPLRSGTLTVSGSVTATNLYATNNLGIGTTTPNYKFDCQGNGSFAGTLNVYDLVASNSITSSGVTKTFKYLELTGDTAYGVNSIIQIGNSVTYTASGGTTTFHLSFPIPEIIFCDSTNGAVRLIMPDVSYIATSTSCKFYVKRTTNNLNQIDIVGYSTSIHNVYDRSYNQNYVAPAIGSSTIILLYNQAWYEF